jgi:hypothetical protein
MKFLCNTVNSCSGRCRPQWSFRTPARRLFSGSHDESAGESGVWAKELLFHWSQNDTRANNSMCYQHAHRAYHVSWHCWWHQLNAGMIQETCPMQTSKEDSQTQMDAWNGGGLNSIGCHCNTWWNYTMHRIDFHEIHFFWWPSFTVAHTFWLNPTYLASIFISCMSALKIVFYRNCENITIDVSDGINPECDDNQANSYKYSRDAFKQCGNIKQDNLILVYIHFYKINQRIGCVFYWCAMKSMHQHNTHGDKLGEVIFTHAKPTE